MKKYTVFFLFYLALLALPLKTIAQYSVTITTPHDSICMGDTIVFTATPAGATVPHYLWQVNRVVVPGEDSAVFTTDTLLNSDTVVCLLTTASGDTVWATSDTLIITVARPPVVSAILGDTSLCTNDSILLDDTFTGGLWSTSNTTASVSSSGYVKGLYAGIDTIKYSITNICGTAYRVHTVTVLPLPVAGSIMCADSICSGTSITVGDTTAGGVWSLSNGKAVLSHDTLTGVSAGMDTVIYAITNSCGTYDSTKIVVIKQSPSSISGTFLWYYSTASQPFIALLCPINYPLDGAYTILTDSVVGGTWSFGPDSIGTIDSSGTINYVYPQYLSYFPFIDTMYLSYTLPNGCFFATDAFILCEGLTPTIPLPAEPPVFPIPATTVLNIQTANTYNECIITDIVGKSVISQPLTSDLTQVDIHLLRPGIYYLTLKGNDIKVSVFVKM